MSEKEENPLSENQAEKCPKCGGEMKSGSVTGSFRVLKQDDLQGDRLYAFYCRDCGFVELYKEASTKEPWRWPEDQLEVPTEEPQQPEKEKPSTETKKRLVR